MCQIVIASINHEMSLAVMQCTGSLHGRPNGNSVVAANFIVDRCYDSMKIVP